MALLPAKGGNETRRGYSDEEISAIYELGRLYLESGLFPAAENIMRGLTEVVPEFAPAWLGLCYLHTQNRNNDAALLAARQAVRMDARSVEAQLFLVACFLTSGDYNSAGTYLGEVGEAIELGGVDNPNVIRFFKAQLARYQSR